jgi:outer membrane protein TolC
MIEEALTHNADLALAIARVDEARAQLAATADLFKALGGGWEIDRQ